MGLAGKRADRGPVRNGESTWAASVQEDLCYSCFADHGDVRMQDTIACDRCGAPQCVGHLVLGECRYCEGMTDTELRESQYAEVA